VADGYLAESAVSTVAVVDGHGMLRSPPAANILDSTTWRRATALAPQLVRRGVLAGARAAPVTEEELRSAREIVSMGGGWVEPVLSLDGQPVGDGQPGAVFSALDEALQADFRNPELTDAVPYA
jgi:D-alanine transaminase